MLTLAITAVVSLAAGFGLGRIKNAKKLAAINAEVAAAKSSVSADVKTLVARIKALL